MQDTKKPRKDQLCHICGDVGLTDSITTCFGCRDTLEHIYCMRVPLSTVPKMWLCEECRLNKGITKEHVCMSLDTSTSKTFSNSVLQPLNFSSLARDPVQSSSLLRRISDECDKINFNSAEEVEERPLKTLKVEFFIPTRSGTRLGQSANSKITYARSPDKFEIRPKNRAFKSTEKNSNAAPDSGVHGNGHAEFSSSKRSTRLKDTKTDVQQDDPDLCNEEPAETFAFQRLEKDPKTFQIIIKQPVPAKAQLVS